MKLAIVRQKYTPFGGAERFVERALAAKGRPIVPTSAPDANAKDLIADEITQRDTKPDTSATTITP